MKKSYKLVMLKLMVDEIKGAVTGEALIPNATVVYGQEKDVVTVIGKEITYRVTFDTAENAEKMIEEFELTLDNLNGNVITIEQKYDRDFQISVDVKDIIQMVE